MTTREDEQTKAALYKRSASYVAEHLEQMSDETNRLIVIEMIMTDAGEELSEKANKYLSKAARRDNQAHIDALQYTFADIYANIGRVKEPGDGGGSRSWCLSRCYQQAKRTSRERVWVSHPVDWDDEVPVTQGSKHDWSAYFGPSVSNLTRERNKLCLDESINKLEPPLREVIELLKTESVPQIALNLGIHHTAVYRRVHRSRELLYDLFVRGCGCTDEHTHLERGVL